MNINYTVPSITATVTNGRDFAYLCRGLSAVERAFIGVDLHLGRLQILNLTLGQAALLAGSNRVYLRHALHVEPERRWTVEAGIVPLIPIDVEKTVARAVRAAGHDRVFDLLVQSL